MVKWKIFASVPAVALLAVAGGALAQEYSDAPPPSSAEINYSPYPGQNFPNQVFFGDTCTRPIRPTQAWSAQPSGPRTPTALPVAKR
jgi:hypothetical protein